MKKWTTDSWKNFPAKHLPVYQDEAELNSVLEKVRNIIGTNQKVMVHLDSDHTHEHVLKELNLYSKFVGYGHYLICGDTIIEYIPQQTHRPRSWGQGNNPKTALDEFLIDNNEFVIDSQFDNKRLIGNQPGGYLKRIN